MAQSTCKQCGKPVAVGQGRLCPDCVQGVLSGSRNAADQRFKEKRAVADSKENRPFNPFGNPVLFIAGSFIALLLLAIVFTLTKSQPTVATSVLRASELVLMTVSALGWGLMWIRLVNENFIVALLCFLLPVGVYITLVTYPEQMYKPFIIHIVCAGLAVASYFTRHSLYPPAMMQ